MKTMKKYYRVSVAVLSMFLLIACQSSQVKVLHSIIHEAKTFTYESAAPIPEEMVSVLGEYPVVIIGEMHELDEHWTLLSGLLQRLHDKNFRYIAVEFPPVYAAVLYELLRGEKLPIPAMDIDHEPSIMILVDEMTKFNQSLRDAGREKEQYQLVGIDVNSRANFRAAIQSIARVHRINVPTVSAKRLIQWLGSRQAESISEKVRTLLTYLAVAEQESYPIMSNSEAFVEAREAYIEKQVLYHMDQAQDGEKILINIGLAHAQRKNMNTDLPDFWPLAARRSDRIGPEKIYSLNTSPFQMKNIPQKEGGIRDDNVLADSGSLNIPSALARE